MNNREIGRVRMYLGALLLLVTVVTWGTGFMMSPHGQTVVEGTQHLRATVVTFKRNAAIGTLIACGLAAWLLFPTRRPKWPARDWAVIALLAFLGGSSIYTLLWLPPSAAESASASDFATNGVSANLAGAEPLPQAAPASPNGALPFGANMVAPGLAPVPPVVGANGRVSTREERRSVADVTEEPAASDGDRASAAGEDASDNNDVVKNQE